MPFSTAQYEIFLRFNCQRKIFFHLLYEMGMDDKAVRHIMGITQEAIRFSQNLEK